MPTPPPPIPPPRPQALTVAMEKLRIVVPSSVVVALVVILTPGLEYLVAQPQPETGTAPVRVPQVPILSSTPAALPALSLVAPGKLPPPGPNQLRAGKCDKRAAQEEINGGCWVQTTTPPPCPEGIQWEHDGRCWLPAALAKPVPTTGEPQTSGVADP